MRVLKAQTDIPPSPLRTYFGALQTYGVTRISYLFSGSGDNGQMDETTYEFNENKNMSTEAIEQELVAHAILVVRKNLIWRVNNSTGSWEKPNVLRLQPLSENLRGWASDTASGFGDWWNNDGGYGSLSIDLANAEWEATVHYHGYDSVYAQLEAAQVDRLREYAGAEIWDTWVKNAEQETQKAKTDDKAQQRYFYSVDWTLLAEKNRNSEEEAIDVEFQIEFEFQELLEELVCAQSAEYDSELRPEITLFMEYHENTQTVTCCCTYAVQCVVDTQVYAGEISEAYGDECED